MDYWIEENLWSDTIDSWLAYRLYHEFDILDYYPIDDSEIGVGD